jgi:hypothetical protein
MTRLQRRPVVWTKLAMGRHKPIDMLSALLGCSGLPLVFGIRTIDRGTPVSALSVGSRINTYKPFLVGRPNMACFFLFLLLPFSINFEIFGEIKNAQIRKFHFEKLFRLKFVQFEICSISNFMFKFEKNIQTRIC